MNERESQAQKPDLHPKLDREKIAASEDQQMEDVYVPEWGGVITVRGLTADERDAYEAQLVDMRGGVAQMNLRHARARLVASCAIDDEGKPVFRPEDVAMLGRKSARAVNRLFTAALRLSGLTGEDIDELVKNS